MTEPSRLLSGWGGTRPTLATLVSPGTSEQVADAVSAANGRGLIARGAGRSYGDAALNEGGVVLDMTTLRGEASLDPTAQEVRVASGTTFGELLLELARGAHTLPVVPGTRHLTVGGAIAADVHGKNHPDSGSFATNLESFELCTPACGTLEVSRESDRELFEATVGGMGLTGVITAATLRVVPMHTPSSSATIDRVDSIEQVVALMAEQSDHSHSIAWIDLLSGRGAFGRAVVTRSSEAARSSPATGARSPAGMGTLVHDAIGTLAARVRRDSAGAPPFARHPPVGVPRGFPSALLRPATVGAFNALHWRGTPRHVPERTLSMSAQLFPLDTVRDWNRLYGDDGLVQYQFAVPRGSEALLRRLPELLRRRRLPMYLAVLKRFGPGGEGMLSFPLEGWTIAIDLPAGAPGLEQGLGEADEILASNGGRVYLAKDARMRPETMAAMYPRLADFREVCARVDPDQRLRSDMARRLELGR